MSILILWILVQLNAPVWTYILWSIAMTLRILKDD